MTLLPAKRIRCSDQIVVGDGDELRGHGIGRTILDFSEAQGAGFDSTNPCVLVEGTATLGDLSVIGPGAGELAAVVGVIDGDHAIVERVHSSGTDYGCILVAGGDGDIIRHCVTEDHSPAVGYNYGVVIGSNTDPTLNTLVHDCDLHGARHGCTMGGGAASLTIGAVVRNCRIQSDVLYGADYHQYTRHCKYVGCDMPQGVTFGGERNKVIGCRIGNLSGPYGNAAAVIFIGLVDTGNELVGCRVVGRHDGAEPALVFWDQDAFEPTSIGAALRIRDCYIESTGRALYFRNRWDDLNPRIEMIRNTIIGTLQSQMDSLGVDSRWATGLFHKNRIKATADVVAPEDGYSSFFWGPNVTSVTNTQNVEFA